MENENTSKKGLIVALVALVVVVLVGIVTYNMLIGQVATTAASAQGQAGAGASASASTAAGASSSSTEGAPTLSEYNATVFTADDDPVKIADIAEGQPLVLNFWATWCPYCVDEMPDFQQIYNEYGDRVSFAFIDCADGQRETVDRALAWLDEQGLDLPSYFDTTQEALYMYGATSLPTTVVFTADGVLTSYTPGRIDVDTMRGVLDGLLAE